MGTTKHFLFAGHAFWGHLRPAIALCASIQSASQDNLVTLLVPSAMTKPADAELKRYSFDHTRLRVIHVGNKESSIDGRTRLIDLGESVLEMIPILPDIFRKLLSHQPVTDSVTKQVVELFKEPIRVAIIDLGYASFTPGILKSIAAELQAEVQFLVHSPVSAPWAMWAMTQSSPGLYMSYWDRCEKINAAVDESDKKSAYDELLGKCEELIQVPGNTPTYVYELQPNQYDAFPPFVAPLVRNLPDWDGLVLVWPSILGQEFQEYWRTRGMPVMQIGPQLPPLTEGDVTFDTSETSVVIRLFLDSALEDDDARSVLYISFGSLFFCPTKDQVEIMLDVLNQLGLRYIFVDGNAPEDVKAAIAQKVKASKGKGLAIAWAQQYAVLAHKATGFFLSHGGSNSFMEAIRMRIPLILWPGTCDQVQTASAASKLYGCAHELLQIRNGDNIGRKTARGPTVIGTAAAIRAEFSEVFEGLKGEFGAHLTQGMQKLADEVDKDAESGLSRQALQRIFDM